MCSETLFNELIDLDFKFLFFHLDFFNETYVFLPFKHVYTVGIKTDLITSLLGNCLDAVDLAVDLQVVPRDNLATEVQLVL